MKNQIPHTWAHVAICAFLCLSSVNLHADQAKFNKAKVLAKLKAAIAREKDRSVRLVLEDLQTCVKKATISSRSPSRG